MPRFFDFITMEKAADKEITNEKDALHWLLLADHRCFSYMKTERRAGVMVGSEEILMLLIALLGFFRADSSVWAKLSS